MLSSVLACAKAAHNLPLSAGCPVWSGTALPLPAALQHPLRGSLLTFSSISMAVRFVVSRFSTRAVSPRNSPAAADSRASRESSSSFSLILNSFWLFVRFAYNTPEEMCTI